MVLAGPGSGKTLTIAKRIEYLITKYKVRPEEILVITFTKYAAGEMKQRFCRIMGTEGIPVNFGTFHSVYYWILKWAYGFNQGNLLLEDEKSAILKEITERMDEESFPEGMDEDGLRELSEEIGNVKNNRKEIESYESRQFDREVFREIYLLTGDYPYDGLYMMQHFMNNTFNNLDYQKMSSAAVLMALVMVALIALLFKVEDIFGKDVEG